jgi:hypothetical protein
MKKIVALLLVLASVISFVGCRPITLPEEMPEDFSFYVQWGVFGYSNYSSQTGVLVKDIDLAGTGKYKTTYSLTQEELKKAYSIIRNLGIESYPEEISRSELQLSNPYCTFTIRATVNGESYSVTAKQASGFDAGRSIEAVRFLGAVKSLAKILAATEAWKALPEVEALYY